MLSCATISSRIGQNYRVKLGIGNHRICLSKCTQDLIRRPLSINRINISEPAIFPNRRRNIILCATKKSTTKKSSKSKKSEEEEEEEGGSVATQVLEKDEDEMSDDEEEEQSEEKPAPAKKRKTATKTTAKKKSAQNNVKEEEEKEISKTKRKTKSTKAKQKVVEEEEEEEEEEEPVVEDKKPKKSSKIPGRDDLPFEPVMKEEEEFEDEEKFIEEEESEEVEEEEEIEEGEEEEEEEGDELQFQSAKDLKESYERNLQEQIQAELEEDEGPEWEQRDDKYIDQDTLAEYRRREIEQEYGDEEEGEGEEVEEEEIDEDAEWDEQFAEELMEPPEPLAERISQSQIEDIEGFEAEEGAEEIKENDFVVVHYTLEDISGKTQESPSTYDEGNQPQTMQVTERAVPFGLAKALLSMRVGQKKRITIPAEEAFGEPDPELMMRVPRENLPEELSEGYIMNIEGVALIVRDVTEEEVFLDANHILSGCILQYEVEILAHYPLECLEIAIFGCGSFWGAELAFQRVSGVIATEVGYANGNGEAVNHDEVESGMTGYAQVVNLVYDPNQITYEELLGVFFSVHDPTQLNRQGADIGPQFRSGIYVVGPTQQDVAEAAVESYQEFYDRPIVTEILPLDIYQPAENIHQQFLENGGRFGRPQSAEKGCRDPIRLYG